MMMRRRIPPLLALIPVLVCTLVPEDALLDPNPSSGCSRLEFPEQILERSDLLAQQGRESEALECLLDGVREFETDWEVWGALGSAYGRQQGFEAQAAQAIGMAYKLRPDDAELALTLGNMVASLGRDAEAVVYLGAASDLRPESAVPHNNMGLAMVRMGDFEGAEEAYRKGLDATEADPRGRCMVMVNLGSLERQLGRADEAIAHFGEAVKLCDSVEARINAGSLLLDQGKYAEAQGFLGEATRAGEHCSVLSRMLAVALGMQDKIREAVESIEDAGVAGCDAHSIVTEAAHGLAQRGQVLAGMEMWSSYGLSSAEDFYHAANMLEAVNDALGAARAFATAQRLHPSHYSATAGLAVLQYKHARFRVAEDLYRRAEKQLGDSDPQSLAEVLHGLGSSIEMTHSRLDQAVACFERSLQLQPQGHNTFFSLLHLRGRLCDWRQWEDMFADARVLLDKGISGGLGPIFALAYPLTDEQLCTLTRIRAKHVLSTIGDARLHFVPWQPRYSEPFDQLGIAVVSADFNMKPVGQLVRSVFGMLDKARFQVFCFSLESSDGSPIVVQIAHECHDFHFVKGLDSLTIANLINAEQTHILLDITGYTDGGRVEVGALKPAPVAVNYLALPYTYAMDGYDFVLTDRVVSPPEMHTACFVERFVMLPSPCYMVNDYRQSNMKQVTRPPLNASEAVDLGVPHTHDGRVVLANFNHLQKLGPATFGLWVRILASCPQCLLWLLRFPSQAEEHIRRELGARGVSQDKLVITNKFANDEHLRVKGAASALLDTLEYNAHVSGLDALWAGLPLITSAGVHMARRCGASFLLALGIPETLARIPEEYVAIAEVVSRDKGKLQRIRERVASARQDASLFDTQGWVAGFERALIAMWEVRVASPDHPRHIILPFGRHALSTHHAGNRGVVQGTGSLASRLVKH